MPNEPHLKTYDRTLFSGSVVSLLWSAIKERRKHEKFPLKALADATGIDPAKISRDFSGEPNWRLHTAVDIASALDLDLELRARHRKTGAVFTASGPVSGTNYVTASSGSVPGSAPVHEPAAEGPTETVEYRTLNGASVRIQSGSERVNPATPFGYTVFCDNIREEVGGKHSFMGVYINTLIVNGTLPANLSTFGMAVYYYETPGESEEPVVLRVFMPGTEDGVAAVEAELPVEMTRKVTPTDYVPKPGDNPLILTQVMIQMAPLELKEPGVIKVRAYRGELEVRLGTLGVRAAAPPVAADADAS